MAKFLLDETIHSQEVLTVRLGGSSAGTRFTDADKGKPVKLGGDSDYVLCAAGDEIEGWVIALSSGPTYDGYQLGSIVEKGLKRATVTGATVAVGDYVVAGTAVALGTALGGYMQVAKAADQAVAKAGLFRLRVASLLGGTGAAGTTVLLKRI